MQYDIMHSSITCLKLLNHHFHKKWPAADVCNCCRCVCETEHELKKKLIRNSKLKKLWLLQGSLKDDNK